MAEQPDPSTPEREPAIIPSTTAGGSERGKFRWVAAAALLLALGVASWGYARYEHQIAVDSRLQERLARQQAAAEQRRAQDEAERRRNAVAAAASLAPSGNAAPLAASAGVNGVYAGPICYGEERNDAARCYRGQATVADGKINGQWPAREAGVTMYVTGTVAPSGDATIEMHPRNQAGVVFATINLVGTVRDGRLDADGSFLNGRTATINWRRN